MVNPELMDIFYKEGRKLKAYSMRLNKDNVQDAEDVLSLVAIKILRNPIKKITNARQLVFNMVWQTAGRFQHNQKKHNGIPLHIYAEESKLV